jgi:hypothetical protein
MPSREEVFIRATLRHLWDNSSKIFSIVVCLTVLAVAVATN